MEKLLEVAECRGPIYQSRYPTGTWVEVKGLVFPDILIEIEMEAHKSRS